MNGAAIPVLGEWLWVPADDRVIAQRVRQFTVVPRVLGKRYSFTDQKQRAAVIALDRSKPNLLGLPRAAALSEMRVGDMDSTMPFERLRDFPRFIGTLRPQQVAAVEQLTARAMPGCVLEALPGKGKTVMLLDMASRLQQRTLVLVNSELLLLQWVRRAKEFLGLDEKSIGVTQGSRMGGFGKPLTIGMAQSICQRDGYTEAWRRCFGLVIFDECDLMPTEVFGRLLPMFPAAHRVAATATLERTDGMSKLLTWHVGPVAASLMDPDVIPDVYVIENAREYRASAYSWMEHKHPEDPGTRRVNYTKLQQILAADEVRNRTCVIAPAVRAWEAKRTTLILTHLREHALVLQRMLTLAGVPATDIGLATGDVKRQEDLDAALTKPVIVATYKMMGRGIDVPAIDCEIFALPLSDVRQAVGRALRYVEGKKTPLVVDPLDVTIFDCRNMFRGRRKFYERIGSGGTWRDIEVDAREEG